MELLFLLLIILLFSIQTFVILSNVILMKLVIHLDHENKQLNRRLTVLESRVRIQEWTQLKLLQERYLQSSDS